MQELAVDAGAWSQLVFGKSNGGADVGVGGGAERAGADDLDELKAKEGKVQTCVEV